MASKTGAITTRTYYDSTGNPVVVPSSDPRYSQPDRAGLTASPLQAATGNAPTSRPPQSPGGSISVSSDPELTNWSPQTPPWQTTPTQGAYATPTVAYNSVPNATSVTGGGAVSQNTFDQQQLQQNSAYLTAEQLRLRAKLQADAESRRLASLQSLGGSAPRVTMDGDISAQEQAARTAAFSRAKDTQGSIALSQLKALQDASASRGLQGSTIEQGHLADLIAERGGGLMDVTRDQYLADAGRAADVADLQYTGGIQQRGQDLDAQRAIFALISAGAY